MLIALLRCNFFVDKKALFEAIVTYCKKNNAFIGKKDTLERKLLLQVADYINSALP